MRCAVGVGEVQGGGGFSSSPFFALVMERVTLDIRQKPLCTMMFAYDFLICSKSS